VGAPSERNLGGLDAAGRSELHYAALDNDVAAAERELAAGAEETPPETSAPADRAPTVRNVQYKGEPLDAARGPGLGCFRFQLVVLGIFIVLTPLSVAWHWPPAVSAGLLIAVIVLLLVAGQTIIFLLRLVAADRRAGRRRPLASPTRTVGELEDEGAQAETGSDEAEPIEPGGVRE